jgi:hypothetical protein
MHSSLFLKRVLLADAVVSGGTGLLMFLGAGWLGGLLSLPEPLSRWAGLALLPYAVFVTVVSLPTPPTRASVWVVIAVNSAWVLSSLFLLFDGARPNALGYAFVIAQATVFGLFAELQFLGLKRLEPRRSTVQG